MRLIVGLLAGSICYWACTWLKQKLNYDDSLDVFGIHGVGGALGTLLCGVFAVAALSDAPGTPGTAGLLEGNSGQMLIQLYGIAVTAVWSGVATFIILKVIELMVPLRVSQQSEIEGLDVTQHGESLQIACVARTRRGLGHHRPGLFSWVHSGTTRGLRRPIREAARGSHKVAKSRPCARPEQPA